MRAVVDFKIDFIDEYSDESIADELRRIAKSLGSDTVTKQEIKSYGKISYSVVYKHFGSLRRALEFAGLNPPTVHEGNRGRVAKDDISAMGNNLGKRRANPAKKRFKNV